jgi:hypothetical protein
VEDSWRSTTAAGVLPYTDGLTRWWAAAVVHESTSGLERHRHPVVGELDLHYETLLLPGDPDQALITYPPSPAVRPRPRCALLAAWAADRPEGEANAAAHSHAPEPRTSMR